MFVWDEDESSSNNQVAAVMVGSSVKLGYVSSIRAGHYGLLRTIEAAWNLPTLTANDGAASPMRDMFIDTTPPPPSPSPSPTRTPTPTTPPPRPTPTGTPINGAPCTVTFPESNPSALAGVMTAGPFLPIILVFDLRGPRSF